MAEKLDNNDVPLDSLVFNPELGGPAGVAPRVGHEPLHPELYTYDESFIAPAVRGGDIGRFVTQDAEQIYRWQVFTPEFCPQLVEEAEPSAQRETPPDIG